MKCLTATQWSGILIPTTAIRPSLSALCPLARQTKNTGQSNRDPLFASRKPLRREVEFLAPFDDPAHGRPQLIFFHGFYEQYQLPTDRNYVRRDRHGCAGRSASRRVCGEARSRRQSAVSRAEHSRAVPRCRDHRACRQRLRRTADVRRLRRTAAHAHLRTGDESLFESRQRRPARTGQTAVRGDRREAAAVPPLEYQADSGDQPRQVVIRCESHALGTNRRAVSTNRPGWNLNPTAVYDEYAERGLPPNRRCPRTETRNSNANW